MPKKELSPRHLPFSPSVQVCLRVRPPRGGPSPPRPTRRRTRRKVRPETNTPSVRTIEGRALPRHRHRPWFDSRSRCSRCFLAPRYPRPGGTVRGRSRGGRCTRPRDARRLADGSRRRGGSRVGSAGCGRRRCRRRGCRGPGAFGDEPEAASGDGNELKPRGAPRGCGPALLQVADDR